MQQNNRSGGPSSGPGAAATRQYRQKASAASCIQRAWLGYKNRQVFRLLKCSLAAAEHSMTGEILRKLAPKEADFFGGRDGELLQLKIRFRFGGTEFPPCILYKIYVDAGQCRVKYVNGRGTIRADSQAAAQSAKMMGNRRYYDLMLQDGLQRLQHGVADEIDVVTVKDFMRLLAVTDEAQAELGGKANSWRRLNSCAAPRHTVFRDVVDYLATRRMTERLRGHLPLLTALGSSQEVRREQLRVLAEVEAPRLSSADRRRTAQKVMSGGNGTSGATSRRSQKALSRASKMRQAYLTSGGRMAPQGSDGDNDCRDEVGPNDNAGSMMKDAADFYADQEGEEAEEEEDFEEEADMLYEWSKELTEAHLGSPRI